MADSLLGDETVRRRHGRIGTTQFEGTTINHLIVRPEFAINTDEASQFLQRVIAL